MLLRPQQSCVPQRPAKNSGRCYHVGFAPRSLFLVWKEDGHRIPYARELKERDRPPPRFSPRQARRGHNTHGRTSQAGGLEPKDPDWDSDTPPSHWEDFQVRGPMGERKQQLTYAQTPGTNQEHTFMPYDQRQIINRTGRDCLRVRESNTDRATLLDSRPGFRTRRYILRSRTHWSPLILAHRGASTTGDRRGFPGETRSHLPTRAPYPVASGPRSPDLIFRSSSFRAVAIFRSPF